jgi:hypothetical protein
MVAPIYPRALVSWTDRIDGTDIVWAADPNRLAAEIISIEQTLGSMPQVEPDPPVGKPVTYSSVSARISDAMLGGQLPYVSITNANFKLGKGGGYYNGQFNTFNQVVSDNWNYFNGSDITIREEGVYLIDASQSWASNSTGYVMMMLVINTARMRLGRWNWADFDPDGTSTDYASTDVHWMGTLSEGDRIRIASQNATDKNPTTVTFSNLHVQYLRKPPPAS